MRFLFISVDVLLNFILGLLFFYVICLWVMAIPFTAQDLGIIFVDPTLDEGTGVFFLIMAFMVSLIYVPILIFVNKALYKKLKMTKKLYYLTLFVSFLIGLFLISFFELHHLIK